MASDQVSQSEIESSAPCFYLGVQSDGSENSYSSEEEEPHSEDALEKKDGSLQWSFEENPMISSESTRLLGKVIPLCQMLWNHTEELRETSSMLLERNAMYKHWAESLLQKQEQAEAEKNMLRNLLSEHEKIVVASQGEQEAKAKSISSCLVCLQECEKRLKTKWEKEKAKRKELEAEQRVVLETHRRLKDTMIKNAKQLRILAQQDEGNGSFYGTGNSRNFESGSLVDAVSLDRKQSQDSLQSFGSLPESLQSTESPLTPISPSSPSSPSRSKRASYRALRTDRSVSAGAEKEKPKVGIIQSIMRRVSSSSASGKDAPIPEEETDPASPTAHLRRSWSGGSRTSTGSNKRVSWEDGHKGDSTTDQSDVDKKKNKPRGRSR